MSQFSEQADFDLTAVRYLSGELSPAETTAFEMLLADDVSACERLADVVELTAAMMTAPSAPDARPTRGGLATTTSSRRSISLGPAALAASIVLAILGGLAALAPWNEDADTRLAQSWIDSSDAVDEALAVENLLVAEQSLTPQLNALQWDGEDEAGWNAPPAWMLAAVALEQEDDLDREATTEEVQQ
ncbi:hypothetical protein M4951_03820 [Blastopirellula sp. J2-11]|uniref:hypothetical protein n=1 Tax=Blastopirellula sp. J2-11 TaxID=2943192 RepID=UPI0021CA6D54|nr:hypothetical protein [Blastopirellula sp. J2-11]UUO07443.1 hypothetical protein M4951_03820 [Blastopirellula sp. J2-11]